MLALFSERIRFAHVCVVLGLVGSLVVLASFFLLPLYWDGLFHESAVGLFFSGFPPYYVAGIDAAGAMVILLLPTGVLLLLLIGSALLMHHRIASLWLRGGCGVLWLGLVLLVLVLYGGLGALELALLFLPTGALVTFLIGCAGLVRPLARFWLHLFSAVAWMGLVILFLGIYALVLFPIHPDVGWVGLVAGYVCMLIERGALSKTGGRAPSLPPVGRLAGQHVA